MRALSRSRGFWCAALMPAAMPMLAAILMLAATPATSAEAASAEVPTHTVVSPGPAKVSVTIYRDHLALITETRELDLPAEAVRLEFQGVTETLLPQSAVLQGAGRPTLESNYRYDPLSPANLLLKSVGGQVDMVRTNRKTGRVTREPATIVAVADGVILRSADGAEALHCSGLPERLVFNAVPEGLTARPTLSIDLAAGQAGHQILKLSYLAAGFDWSADYVARLDAPAQHLRLRGWATLVNHSDASFRHAEVQLVAGTLNYVPMEEGGSKLTDDIDWDDREVVRQFGSAVQHAHDDMPEAPTAVVSGCYALKASPGPPPPKVAPAPAPMTLDLAPAARMNLRLEEVVVTSAKLATREQLADYQLYRLPEPTDLAARQTKQVAFLDKSAVKANRFYRYRLPALDAAPDVVDGNAPPRADVMLGFENTAAAGLGEPLPGGTMRVFETSAAGAELFSGEALIEDKAVGLPVEFAFGSALDFDLQVSTTNRRLPGLGGERLRVDVDVSVQSAKPAPVLFEFRHAAGGWRSIKLSSADRTHMRKAGDYAWRFTVPAGASEQLHYRISGRR